MEFKLFFNKLKEMPTFPRSGEGERDISTTATGLVGGLGMF